MRREREIAREEGEREGKIVKEKREKRERRERERER